MHPDQICTTRPQTTLSARLTLDSKVTEVCHEQDHTEYAPDSYVHRDWGQPEVPWTTCARLEVVGEGVQEGTAVFPSSETDTQPRQHGKALVFMTTAFRMHVRRNMQALIAGLSHLTITFF